MARSIWGGENPTGARIKHPFGEAEVVGVVGDVRTRGLDGDPSATVYMAASQGTFNFMTVIVKTHNDAGSIAPALRMLVRELDADLPVHHVRTVDDLITGSVARQRFQMVLVSSFSFLVFLLAVVGTFGVVSYTVSERTGELGIRMALGASGGDIKRLVLSEGARLALQGVVLGTVASAALSRTLSRFVFQISVLDPVTFFVTPLVLALAVILATWLPAHRASRVDPMRVLRVD